MRATYISQSSFARFRCRSISEALTGDLSFPVDRASPDPFAENLPPLKPVAERELWGELSEESIGRVVSHCTLREVSILRCLNRHWLRSIDRSIRDLRVTSISTIPTQLLKRFEHLQRLNVEHMDELHYCDIQQLHLLQSLRYLTLQGMRLSNNSLKTVGECRGLIELTASDITLSKNCTEALDTLCQLTLLTKLCMRYIEVEKIDYGGNYCVETISKILTLKHLECRFDMSTEVLDRLSALTRLEVLCLSSTTLHIPNLYFLEKLTRVKHLSLPWTHFAIYDAAQIDLLADLTYLDLGATDVTDDSLKDFSRLTSLKHLSLKDDCIGDGSIEHLSTLTQLESLDVSHGAGLSDLCSLRYIPGLSSMKFLNLNGTHVGDEDVEYLLTLTQLRRLDIGLTSMTDGGIQALTSLTKLEAINTEIARNPFDEI